MNNQINNMQLVDSKTKEPLVIGQAVQMHDGTFVKLTGCRKPHKPSSSGFVYVKTFGNSNECEYYPNVIGAEFFPRPDRED